MAVRDNTFSHYYVVENEFGWNYSGLIYLHSEFILKRAFGYLYSSLFYSSFFAAMQYGFVALVLLSQHNCYSTVF